MGIWITPFFNLLTKEIEDSTDERDQIFPKDLCGYAIKFDLLFPLLRLHMLISVR
jgi:hypothetical protein